MKCCNIDHDPPKRTAELIHEFKRSALVHGYGPSEENGDMIGVEMSSMGDDPQRAMAELIQVLKCATLVMTLLRRG